MKRKTIIVAILVACGIFFTTWYVINRNTYNIFTVNQEIIDSITWRFDHGKSTREDKRTMKRIYGNMIFAGKFIYPEASEILDHYLFGDGSDLILTSDYIWESKTVQSAIKRANGKKLIGPVTLKIEDDKRLAYAINKFYIDLNKQEITCDGTFESPTGRRDYTWFKIAWIDLNIPDRLIHIFDDEGGCIDFMIRIKNTNNSQRRR